MIYKFVKWEVPDLSTHENTTHYRLHESLKAGVEPSREDKNRWLVFSGSNPVHKYMGYVYDFRPFLKEFWVSTKYYGIVTVWAWDKTAIRKHESNLQIRRIVQVSK